MQNLKCPTLVMSKPVHEYKKLRLRTKPSRKTLFSFLKTELWLRATPSRQNVPSIKNTNPRVRNLPKSIGNLQKSTVKHPTPPACGKRWWVLHCGLLWFPMSWVDVLCFGLHALSFFTYFLLTYGSRNDFLAWFQRGSTWLLMGTSKKTLQKKTLT